MEPARCFISYAREDLDRVRPIVKLIEDNGWSVFWDRTIPTGLTWRSYIGKALDEASCVIVVWSRNSVKSDFVQEEADDGRERGILIPIRIDKVRLPLGFRAIQHEDFGDWEGKPDHPRARSLIRAIENVAGKPQKRVAGPSEEPKAQALSPLEQLSPKTEEPIPDSQTKKATEELPNRLAKSSPKKRKASFFLKLGPLVVSLSFATIIFAVGIKFWFKAPNQEVPGNAKFEQSQKKPTITALPKKAIESKKNGRYIPKTFTNTIGMEFVLIPAGTFEMGSGISPEEVTLRYGGYSGAYKNEHPQHSVQITESFYLQETEVTQGQWEKVMKGDLPTHFMACRKDCPIEQVSWDDTQKFIKELNDMEGTDSYRLPTEAEWEYAARAGSRTVFLFGNDASKLDEYGWYDKNSGGKTHPARGKKPNSWGLYDMYGNVWEWCQDWYDDDFYRHSPSKNPNGPATGTNRVVRGGSWDRGAEDCRSATRNYNWPGYRNARFGFRLAKSIMRRP